MQPGKLQPPASLLLEFAAGLLGLCGRPPVITLQGGDMMEEHLLLLPCMAIGTTRVSLQQVSRMVKREATSG